MATKVKRALYDDFKGWEESGQHVRTVNNKTLFDTLCDAHNEDEANDRPSRLGSSLYYAEIRRLFRPANDPMEALKAKPVNGLPPVIDPNFMKAMIKARDAHRPDRGPMHGILLTRTKAPSQAEAVGNLKFISSMKVGCGKQLTIALNGLECCERFEHPAEIQGGVENMF